MTGKHAERNLFKLHLSKTQLKLQLVHSLKPLPIKINHLKWTAFKIGHVIWTLKSRGNIIKIVFGQMDAQSLYLKKLTFIKTASYCL